MEELWKLMDILSKVKLNRNDTEQQIFTKYFNSMNQNLLKEYFNSRPDIGKDIELSKNLRMTGNRYYQEKNYAEAMTCYTTSLTKAPRDNVEYALTIANRSAVLNDLKRYKECLVDIERVLKSEYPKHLLYKIFIRQAHCYLELKCYGKASKAVQNAKSSYEIAKVLLKKELSEVIREKIKDIEKCLENTHSDTDNTVQDDQEQSSLPELTAGENPRFAYASNTVSMRKNKLRGRHVVACMDIKKGDILFVEQPYSTCMCLFNHTYFTYCSHCVTSSLTCIPCTSCSMLLFCSDQCRQQYWDSRHRWECAGLRWGVITADCLALGVLFRASHTGFNTTIPDNKVYGNKIDNFPYVNQLMTHTNNIPEGLYTKYVHAAVLLIAYLIHCTDYFDWLYAQHNRPYGSLDELHRMVGGLLLKILCQNDTNKEEIRNTYVARSSRYGIGLKRNKLTYALYVSSSAVNHACLPNAVTSFYGCVKVVRAITDIKKGTEITVCYLEDPNMYDPITRRQKLLDEYYFTCTCSACADDHSLFPWLCTECRGPAVTTSSDQIAKCTECKHVFQLDKYMQLKDMTKLHIATHCLTFDTNILEEAVGIMEQIYHETNWNLSVGYIQFVYQYDARGDFKSCLKYVQLLVDLFKLTYKYSASKENVKMLLKYSLTMVRYSLSLKYKKPGLYKKYLKLTKEVIDNTTELLTYHMCRKLAVNFQQNMLRLLDVGDDDFDKAMRLFHYNIIHTQ